MRANRARPARFSLPSICLEVAILTAMVSAGIGMVATPAPWAQSLDPGLWVANGPVHASALSGKTLYIGGGFSYVGPYTGASVLLDAGGDPVAGFPRVRGIVHAVVGDGSAGWFIGGTFDSVGGVPRRNLAHVRADHTVGAWNPGADGLVITLARSGETVYAGGAFASAGGQPRSHMAALSAESGAALPWDPGANANVWALVVSGDRVFAGGDFTAIGGEARSYIAALDVSTGLATAWNPAADLVLNDLAVSGNIVYAAGYFTNIGGQARNRIAALDATTGLATDWDPNSILPVFALAVDGNTVYAGGDFVWDTRLPPYPTIGGQTRNYVAALDAATGLATTWSPYAPGRVRVIAVVGKTVFIGGDTVAEIDKVTGQATAEYALGLGAPRVWAIWPNTSTVYVGGEFGSLGGKQRRSLAALNIDTGRATDWNPGVTSTSPLVRALAVSGNTVYVGGDFGYAPGFPEPTIGGQPRNRIAALDAETGLPTPWNPNADNPVWALAATEGTVYAGGFFSNVGGQPRSRIAALDVASGLATSWNPGASSPVTALAVAGSTVYAGGAFTTIAGQARSRIAALDAATGEATGWNPNANTGSVRSIVVDGGLVYVGGSFTSIGGQPRDRIAALSATDGLATSWAPGANGTVRCLAVGVEAVYAGGEFTFAGGRACGRLAALDAATGLAQAWDAGADQPVATLAARTGSVFAGGEFTTLFGGPHFYLARIRDDALTPTLVSAFSAVWRPGGIEIAWSFAEAAGITSVLVERAPRAEGPWMQCAVEVGTDGPRTTAVDRDVQEGATYWYRLVATGAHGARAVFGPIAVTNGRGFHELALGLPSPNPAHGVMRVEFELPRRGWVRLLVLDVQGREQARLLDGDQWAGHHEILWDGSGRDGSLPAGVYFLRLETRDGVRTRRAIVTR